MDASKKVFQVGSIISADLTVGNAEEIRDFYKAVVGWETEELTMRDEQGEYADYVLKDQQGNWVGGVCHARGSLVDLPPQWLVYINVADIDASLKRCTELGGKTIKIAREADGTLQYVVIQDPAGAVIALTKEA